MPGMTWRRENKASVDCKQPVPADLSPTSVSPSLSAFYDLGRDLTNDPGLRPAVPTRREVSMLMTVGEVHEGKWYAGCLWPCERYSGIDVTLLDRISYRDTQSAVFGSLPPPLRGFRHQWKWGSYGYILGKS